MKISCVSLRFWYSYELSSSKRARRAFALGLASLGVLPHPLEFSLDGLLARGLGGFFLLEARVFLLEPRAVVAFPRYALAAVEFEDPLRRVVEKVAVVRHRHHGARKFLQELLEPVDALGIEMVGRLVEQQHVGLGEQQPAQRDAALFAARQRTDLRIPRRQAQRVGRDLELVLGIAAARREYRLIFGLLGGELVEVGVGLGVGGVDFVELLFRFRRFAEAFLHRLAHGLVRIELRLLRQKTDAHVGHRYRFAVEVLVLARHDLEQARLARAVQAQHADLGAGEERQRNILEDLALGRHDLADPLHGVNVLGHNFIRLEKCAIIADRARSRRTAAAQ